MEDRIFEKGRIDSLSIYSLLLNSRALQERLDAIALNVWPLILLILLVISRMWFYFRFQQWR